MENNYTSAVQHSAAPCTKSSALPDFASAMAVVSYYPTPSPADSGVMSPMTPLSNYTQGSTPEQAFMTSPEHLNYATAGGYDHEFSCNNASASSTVPSAADSPYSSDEGVVMPKCNFYEYEAWAMSAAATNTVSFIVIVSLQKSAVCL